MHSPARGAPTVDDVRRNPPTPSHPVLLFDVMSTMVTEPFLDAVPRHFGMSFDEFRASLIPGPWVEFEHGRITEKEYLTQYFKDGRTFDVPAFKQMLFDSYDWMDGVEPLLVELQNAGYTMFSLSNYSSWYEIIESKLTVSRFMNWDFVSCRTGHRKPAPDAYLTPIRALGGPPQAYVFIDDRPVNIRAAEAVGMKGILRTPNIADLRRDLAALGILADRSTKSG